MSDVRVLIVGGGPVGMVLALALQQKDIAVTLLEAREKHASHQDQRALAISYGTRQILHRLNVWNTIKEATTAINTIHVSQKGSVGRARLRAEDHGQEALGYVVPYGILCASLDDVARQCQTLEIKYGAEVTAILPQMDVTQVTYRDTDTLHNKTYVLVALADGGRSLGEIAGMTREMKKYGHDALVSKVSCELPHDNIAYERFTPQGPMALLPNGARDFSLVWTGKHAEIQSLLTMNEAEFLQKLHVHFGDRVGRFLTTDKRMSFPLQISSLKPTSLPHLAVIGNAAQTMHPVAGQGFNIGIRDAWELAHMVAKTPQHEWGSEMMMKQYQQTRKLDTQRGLIFTDFLVHLFSNEIVGVSALRSVGIGLLDIAKPIKNRLVQKMSFGSRG